MDKKSNSSKIVVLGEGISRFYRSLQQLFDTLYSKSGKDFTHPEILQVTIPFHFAFFLINILSKALIIDIEMNLMKINRVLLMRLV